MNRPIRLRDHLPNRDGDSGIQNLTVTLIPAHCLGNFPPT